MNEAELLYHQKVFAQITSLEEGKENTPYYCFHAQTQHIMCYKKIRFLLFAALSLITLGLRAQNPCNLTVDIDPPAEISCQNPTVQLQTNVVPTGNYQYSWFGPAQLPNVPNPVISVPGYYAVFVTDGANCWGGDSIQINQDGTIPVVTITGTFIDCDGEVELTATASIIGGGSLSYLWSNGSTEQTVVVPSSTPGTVTTYCVTVTNSNGGCTGSDCTTVGGYTPLSVTLYYSDSPFCNDSSGLWVQPQGGLFPYAYLWSNGGTGGGVIDPSAGTYSVTVTDERGCTAEATYVIEEDQDECAHLEGYVLADWNTNCTKEATDEGLTQVFLKITNSAGDEFFMVTDANGFFQTSLFPDTYTIEVQPPNNLWLPCQAYYTLTLNPNETQERDFLLQPVAICPAMSVDLSTPLLRRCFFGNYWVNYCNQGTADATDAYVEVQIDDFLTVTSATVSFTNLGNNLYRFDIGDVAFNTCGIFYITVEVSCDAVLGQIHCSEATIYPTGSCEPNNPQWSGASLEVEAECNNDSLEFTIRNVGTGITTEPLEYVIIEDAVMFMNAPPPTIYLAPSEEHHFKVPANGATWRVEVEQEPFHPGESIPTEVLEGCANGGQFSIGFVNQFSMNDNDPWVDIDCTPNVGSYDPNDKQGFPIGYGAAHYIKPGTDLEYLIRFQNTGTDTAFTVVIRDTLSAWLDPATVRPGASSHPYTFEFYGDRNIKFRFDNILLPDSSTNQEASNGFVSFRIAQKADVPLQSDILNSAAIFFDLNAPVITNTTVHRVAVDFVTLSAWQPLRDGLELRVQPNPVAQSALLELRGIEGLRQWEVVLTDATGRLVRSASASGEQWRFERGDLPAGLYLLQVRSNGQLLGSGKVVLK